MDIPFSYRVLALLALMALVAGVDRYRRGAASVRYLEYGFILLCGLIGSSIGAINDLITSGISPDYFVLGKGLPAQSVRFQALLLGLKTGFSAGVIGGAVCLFSMGRKPLRWPRLCRLLVVPVASAVFWGVTLPLLFSKFDPAGLASQLTGLVTAEQLSHFRVVWWIHSGLYAGLAFGLAAMIFILYRTPKGSGLKTED